MYGFIMSRRIRLGIVLCLVIQSLTEAACTKPKEDHLKFNEVYVSQTTGIDRPSCGTELQPCKSISAGVWRADFNVHVYIDGTGTQTSPYPCQSSSLQFQGIYVNKSLSLIGIKSPVNVKCRDGLGIRFNSPHLNSSQTIIKVMNILFLESPIRVQDVNLRIDNCNFVNGLTAITLTQSYRSVALSFTNSSCLNTTSCIIAESRNTRKEMQGILSIHLIDSNVRGSPITPTLPSSALGIHVVSSDVTPGSIFCDITLQNVIFTDNYIGPKGVIHVAWDSGLSSLRLDDVLFYGNDFVSRGPSNIILIQSYDYEVLLNHSTFSLINSSRVMKLDAKNNSKLSILNSHFTGGLPIQGSEGLLYLDSKHDSQVFIVNTTFTNIRNYAIGSCMHLSSETASVQIANSTFVNNHGGCAGIFWMLAKESLAVVFQGSYFESNGADGPGGLASCLGKVVNITMLDSKINGSHASGPGGVFDIGFNGCGSQKEIFDANLVFKNMTIEHCSCFGPGGIAVIGSTNGSITVYSSFFDDIKATGPGGVFSATAINPALHNASFSIEIIDALFKYSSTSAPAGVITANRVEKLLLDRLTIDSAVAGQGPGGALYIKGRNNLHINITNSTFKNCQASAPGGVLYLTSDNPVRISISDSIFKSAVSAGPGGCLYLYIKQCHVHLTNVTFRNCHATGAPGGAILLQSVSTSKLTFGSCSFLDNTAQASVGGAVLLDLPKDYISDPGCIKQHSFSQTIPHRSWKYNSNVEFIDTVFTNNTAQTGGALMLSRGQHLFHACSFQNNFANLRGGHIFSDLDSTSIRIYSTKILQTRKTQVLIRESNTMTLRIASFIETNSQGPLILINSSLEFQPLGDVKPLVMLSQGGFVSFGENNRTSLICPRGSDLQIVNFTNVINTEYKSHECRIILSVLQFNCKSCGLGYYSLQHGRSAGLQKIGSFECLPCPYGAECLHNIAARENFWGYNVPQPNPPALNFTDCPTGYCKHPDGGDPLEYNSCHGNRSGVLCGECKRGYTETLLSASCRHEVECQDTWLWGVAALMLLLMATYLVHKPRLSLFFRKQIFWFQKSNGGTNDEGSSSQHEDDVTYHDKGYLKIVFYFYQVANLLLISTSYDSIVERYLLQPVIGLFSFQFRFSSKGFLCPFPGLTVVTKELLFASQVFGVSFMILFCYLCHFLFCKCVSRTPQNLGRYLGALLETMLLGYAVFANTAFKLLRCRTIGDESRLFISGQVACYQWWQYLLMAFVGLVVVPFILMLGLGSHWLNKGSISVKGFLLGCVLPLPYLMCKLASHVFCQRHQPSEEPVEWRTSMKNVLFGPFRRPEGGSWGALYWESVLTGRRLIIIIIFVSLSDPLCKQLLLTFVCVFILFHHTVVRPFRKATANAAEMASLLGLVAIAIINTFKASFLTTGQNPQGPLQSSAEILDWTQVIILSIVPVLFCLLIILFVVSQVIRFITMMGILMFKICCKRFFMTESRPLLEPTKYYDSVAVET